VGQKARHSPGFLFKTPHGRFQGFDLCRERRRRTDSNPSSPPRWNIDVHQSFASFSLLSIRKVMECSDGRAS
jgi:hypothetical protein